MDAVPNNPLEFTLSLLNSWSPLVRVSFTIIHMNFGVARGRAHHFSREPIRCMASSGPLSPCLWGLGIGVNDQLAIT